MYRLGELAARDGAIDLADLGLPLDEMAHNNVTSVKRMDIDYAEICIDSGIGSILGNLQGKLLYNRLYDCFSSVCRLEKSKVL